MATYPIKVLLDRNRQPFIPFATTSSIVENGTNRRLDKILGNLDDLQTNNKNSLVSAINEILTQHGSGGSSTGWQVVNVLPTENISATTIYLLPKEGATKPNIYEEWIWVNNDWESIGTTEIDLTGYATTTMIGDLNTLQTTDKDSVVDAINEIVGTAGGTNANIGNLNNLTTEDKSSIVNAINEVMDSSINAAIPVVDIRNNSMIGTNYIFADSEDRLAIAEAIRKTTKDGTKKGTILIIANDELSLMMIKLSGATNNRPNYSFLGYGSKKYKYSNSRIFFYDGNIVLNDDFTFYAATRSNGVYICEKDDVITKTNTTSYTPTADYHPATKKYVDDSIAAAGTGSSVDLSNYLAKDNTTEFTPTGDYNPSTKKYVDDKFSSVPTIDSYTKTEVDTKLANYLAKDNLTEYTPTSDYHPATKKFVETVVSSIDTSGFITESNISNHLANYITETTLNEKLMKVPYIMIPSVTITSDYGSSDYWGDNILMCNINNTDWSAAIQKIAQAILSKNWPKVYLPIAVFPNVDDFNRAQTNKMFRRRFLMELKPSNFGYFADEISHTYTSGDEISTYFDGIIDLGIYGTLNVSFNIIYQYDGTSWTYSNYSNPYAHLYIGRVTPVSSLNLTFDNKQIVHSYTEGYKHSRVFSSQVTGCKNLPVNATTKIADLAGTSTLPDGLSTKCELLGTTVSGDITTYTPLGEATVFVYNREMYMKVPDITTTDYTDVVCTISMIYED